MHFQVGHFPTSVSLSRSLVPQLIPELLGLFQSQLWAHLFFLFSCWKVCCRTMHRDPLMQFCNLPTWSIGTKNEGKRATTCENSWWENGQSTVYEKSSAFHVLLFLEWDHNEQLRRVQQVFLSRRFHSAVPPVHVALVMLFQLGQNLKHTKRC